MVARQPLSFTRQLSDDFRDVAGIDWSRQLIRWRGDSLPADVDGLVDRLRGFEHYE